MTDFVKIALATDRVHPSQQPETWKIGPLVRVAVVLGVLMLVEALGLLAVGWYHFGLAGANGRRQTFTFQILLFFALFSIVSVRERRHFWQSWPSALLAAGLVADAIIGALVGIYGLAKLEPLPTEQSAFVFGYAAICTLGLNDVVKSFLTTRALRATRSQI